LYDKKNVIFGGDFNNSFEFSSQNSLEKKWVELCKLFKLEEAEIAQENKNQFLYTWTNSHLFTRIDRLYFKKTESSISLNYSKK